jgi:hypothetical protein
MTLAVVLSHRLMEQTRRQAKPKQDIADSLKTFYNNEDG